MPQKTLAAAIREAYPGQWADVSDADLEDAIRKSYPGQFDSAPLTPRVQSPAGADRNTPDNPQTPRNAVLADMEQRMGNVQPFVRKHLPMLAAAASAPFTAGMSALPAMGVGGGMAAAGSVIRNLAMPREERPDLMTDAAISGAWGAGPEMVRGLRTVGPALGRRLWASGAGEPRGSVVEDVLAHGRGWPTRFSGRALREEAKAGTIPAKPAVPAVPPVRAANGRIVTQGKPAVPATPTQWSPLWAAAKSHERALTGGAGLAREALGVGAGAAAGFATGHPLIGSVIGGLAGVASHPAMRMAAGQAAYSSQALAKYPQEVRAALLALMATRDGE